MPMAGDWTSERFPQFEREIRELIEQHRQLDEPLHLALSYSSPRNRQDIFLFEVVSGPLADTVNEERDFFEVSFLPSSGFPMKDGEELHLILTNPAETRIALNEGWPKANEIVGAVRAGEYRVLFSDAHGDEILDLFKQTSNLVQGVCHG